MKALLRFLLLLIVAAFMAVQTDAGNADVYLSNGWRELTVDNDAEAIRWFGRGLDKATEEGDTIAKAEALLYIGIGSYGASSVHGLEYARRAMSTFATLEQSRPAKALEGRSRCLQLISSIYMRQGKYEEVLRLSRMALAGFPAPGDSTGTRGLIFNSIAGAHRHLGHSDSEGIYLRLALNEQRAAQNLLYLPAAYLNVGQLELAAGRNAVAHSYYDSARHLADSTGNRQAQVLALLGTGYWSWKATGSIADAEAACYKALAIANALSDKTFRLKVLGTLRDLSAARQDYKAALALQTSINTVLDSVALSEKQETVSILETQFKVSEKDRELRLLHQEREIGQLNNYMLWGAVVLISLILGGIVLFLRKVAKKDKQLLQRKDELLRMEEALRIAQAKEHQQAAAKLAAEVEHGESRLSALTMQMLQRNELLQELKAQLEKEGGATPNIAVTKIINRGLNHDKDWSDFNTYFEGINRNFYTRLKQVYSDISPNDLKICALIKMNLSTKEMAGILNISPDSVKTARYRLRKKLGLQTEDSLTDFIMQL